ncbi:MAG TPA: hypothetical protein VMU45_04865 [Candidatus Eisenbacteria bacterium]|nr:hypothetical protein [Candidatus Eisenbacteria bacterium]
MLSPLQDILIVFGSIVAALLFWWLVRRLWPPERRRIHNEITGWQISVLGTTYAVIVGFMLFAVWSDFQTADRNVEIEAGCLVNLYWAASGLPLSQRQEIRKLASDYADAMITEEWPAMNRGALTHAGTKIIEQFWESASQAQSLNAVEQVSLEHAMSEIGSITEHRRIRQLQSQASLPAVLWTVLIVGAMITIMSSCLFGSEYPSLHVLQVVTLALLLSLSLVTIADINRPFRGTVHVQPMGFENAKRMFEKYGGTHGNQ